MPRPNGWGGVSSGRLLLELLQWRLVSPLRLAWPEPLALLWAPLELPERRLVPPGAGPAWR
jgi:hypothetical protein